MTNASDRHGGFHASDCHLNMWCYLLSRMGPMRQEFDHPNQWRNQDNEIGLSGLTAGPDSKENKSHCSPHNEPDNTKFSFAEEMKCPPSSPRANLASNSLADLLSRHNPRTYQILLLVTPEKVKALTGIQWHRSQRCTIRPDGYAMIEFRVRCLSAVKSWLKHHAPTLQIIRTVRP